MRTAGMCMVLFGGYVFYACLSLIPRGLTYDRELGHLWLFAIMLSGIVHAAIKQLKED